MTRPMEPMPVPTNINVGTVVASDAPDGRPYVVLQTSDFTGTKVSFLPPQAARDLAAQLIEKADASESKLVIPVSPEVLRFAREHPNP